MPYLIGIVVSSCTALFGRLSGFDRGRSFYPTVLIVVASYYVLFAIMAGSTQALIAEIIQLLIFAAIAIVGYKTSEWYIVAGLAAHGLFDIVHHSIVANPGVPAWWPAWCLSYDVGLALLLALNMRSRSFRTTVGAYE